MKTALPIDAHLEEAARSLSEPGSVLIVEASPGAGKTTRLPARFLSEPWCTGKVLVTEPRRIAARLAAHYVTSEREGVVGAEVGYQVRYEDKTSAATRLVYATEGLVLRQLLERRELPNVSVVVLDEVHERSADLDVLLALLRGAKAGDSELRLVLMSATLQTEEFKKLFTSAYVITSPGRSFEVSIEHLPKEDDRHLAIQVRSAVRSTLSDNGDILVFLPGGAEIRSCEEALAALPDVDVLPLHGDLPLSEQARAMRSGSRKRIILSTNVAESSVTIPGVTVVIDSGLARTAVFDRWSGVKRLETVEVSQARLAQRAGRAGRVKPGRALRLFTKGSYERRSDHDTPPLLREDLSGVFLMLLAGGHRPHELPWMSSPDSSAWDQAEELLTDLGAMKSGRLTQLGKEMAKLPTSPRLARIVIAGRDLGIPTVASRAAALLSEKDILLRARTFRRGRSDVVASDSDVEDRLDRLEELEASRFDPQVGRYLELDVKGARELVRAARALERAVEPLESRVTEPPENALCRALLTGFPDRVAERRGESNGLVLSTGAQAVLHESSSVVGAHLLLAVSTDAPGGQRRKAQVRMACRLEPDLLMDVAGERIEARDELSWNDSRGRLEQVSRLTYGRICLDESRSWAHASKQGAKLLMKAALAKGPPAYDPEGHLEKLSVRLSLVARFLPEVLASDKGNDLSKRLFAGDDVIPSRLAEIALLTSCETRTSLSELAQARLDLEIRGLLPVSLSECLERDFPDTVRLAGGRVLDVHYEHGRDPWIQSRLQDFFSMNETPTLCRGRLPLQLHLLAPNQRAVQVTKDLAGFWQRHYPELRKQLMRRYPKHLWPEDGRTASPPTPGRIR